MKYSKNVILTYSGIFMDPLNPAPEDIDIRDIAHALSMICRAGGHFPEVHTVAQHCLECSDEAAARGYSDLIQFYALMHDAAEAYLGDFVHPVKARMPEYKETEEQLLNTIYEKYAGRIPTEEEEKLVKEIDINMLWFEFVHYMGIGTGDPGNGILTEPAYQEEPRAVIAERFLERFRELTARL